jgi:hypothetical protein
VPSRQSGYPLSFRVQVYRVHAPSRVSRQWFSPRDASLSSFGSRRARFPALSGTMKALRLPICVSVVAYWFASTAHPILQLRVRRSAPRRSEVPSRPGLWVAGRPSFRLSVVWTQLGPLRSSGDPSPCLCSVPRPRSNQCALAIFGHIDAAPATHTAKASAIADFGADSRSFGTRCHTLRASCCHSRARLASGWLARLYREGVEPSGPR